MNALVLGRFHAVTRSQADWLASLRSAPVEKIYCVVTSANLSNTRRNPLDAATREAMLRPALAASGKPFEIIRVADVVDSGAWVEHVLTQIQLACGVRLTSQDTELFSANRDVDGLFRAQGFVVVSQHISGLTPHELVQRVIDGHEWKDEASPETREIFSDTARVEMLKKIFGQTLINDDGELGHLRDFGTYGAQMDASLQQKLDDLLQWVKPGSIVDKGCGTGKLLVELAKRFPKSGFVGVDLSREFLRMCDENHYASEDVALVFGNIIDRNVEPGSATTVIFSSVTHEIYSYTDYSLSELDRAFVNAAAELAPGGHLIMRDGVSPEPATWRLKFLKPEVRAVFERFAKEFKHGAGAVFENVSEHEVRLSSHDANEFVCKKDYLKNWHIEVHEEYGAHTLNGYRDALVRAGLEPVSVSGYVNPWIAANRYQGTVALTDDAGVPLPQWPDTNCVIVARKR